MKKFVKEHLVSVILMLVWIYPLILFCNNPNKIYIMDVLFIPSIVITAELTYFIVKRRYRT